MQASLSYGLRAGTNTLTVKLRRHGHRRRATVRFGLNPPGAAGRGGPRRGRGDRRRCRAGGPDRTRAPTREAIEWTPIRVPEAAGNDCPAPRAATALRSPDGLTASFSPQSPGTYVYRMTAREGGKTVSDTVQVDASSPNRMVPIETMIGSGAKAGITVGKYTYLLSEAGGAVGLRGCRCWCLSRHNLECVSNTRYAKAAEVQGALKQLDSSKLVIVADQPGAATAGPRRQGALRRARRDRLPDRKGQDRCRWRRGRSPGSATSGWRGVRPTSTSSPAGRRRRRRWSATWLPDQYNNFGFVPPQSEPFSLLDRAAQPV